MGPIRLQMARTFTPTPVPDKQLKAFPSRINPGRGEYAHIRWFQAESAPASMKIYNLRGELVKDLIDNVAYAKGEEHMKLFGEGVNKAGSTVASGIYLVVIRAGDYKDRVKVAVIR